MNRISVVAFLLLMLSITGCSTRVGDFSVISTRNVEIGSEYELVKRDVEGESKIPIIIVIPAGVPSIIDAVDDALELVDGDLLMNAKIHDKSWYIPYIYGEWKYVITADAYRKVDPSMGDSSSDIQQGQVGPEEIYRYERVGDEYQLVRTN